MVQSINLFQDGNGLFGGFSGFLNRSPLGLGNQDRAPLSGLLDRSAIGLQSNPLQIPNNPLLQRVEQQKQNEKADEKKKDEVELSDFIKEAADEAVSNARKTPGATSQVFVSEDGRFEVSVDLQVRSDGSFDLDLAVGFAQSRGAAIESTQNTQQLIAKQDQSTDGEVPETTEDDAVVDPNASPLQQFGSTASAIAQQYTSYEQSLSTRDLQVNIFFEEAKSVAFNTEQKFGSETADQFSSVAGQISNEFKLNINISGSDISNFNQAASDLLQFDESGTLSGFLGAASNVLNSNPNDIGSFIDAARALVGATKDHVSSRINSFFTDLNSEFGGQLEELGFTPDYLQNLGNDVQNDLNSFFSITNELLANLSGTNQIEDQEDVDNAELSILEENLEQLNEARNERINSELNLIPEYIKERNQAEESSRQTLEELLASLAEEDQQTIEEEQAVAENSQPVDGNLIAA